MAPTFLAGNFEQQSVTWTWVESWGAFAAPKAAVCSWQCLTALALGCPQLHSCPTATSCPALTQVTVGEWGVCGHRRHIWGEREKHTSKKCSSETSHLFPRVGAKVHFCEHCSCCASCTCAGSRCLLRTFLVDVVKQINLGIPALSNQHRVLGRMQAQGSITQISHLAVVQGLPELWSVKALCDYGI